MPSRRELPRSFEADLDDDLHDTGPQYVFVGHGESRPQSEYEALMVVQPHSDPDVSRNERLLLRDAIVDAIDGLDEEDRWIFDALFIRRTSLRSLEQELQVPKTTLARRRDRITAQLREALAGNEQIERYLSD